MSVKIDDAVLAVMRSQYEARKAEYAARVETVKANGGKEEPRLVATTNTRHGGKASEFARVFMNAFNVSLEAFEGTIHQMVQSKAIEGERKNTVGGWMVWLPGTREVKVAQGKPVSAAQKALDAFLKSAQTA